MVARDEDVIRNEVLEEAAKVCEREAEAHRSFGNHAMRTPAGRQGAIAQEVAARNCSTLIRALKREPNAAGPDFNTEANLHADTVAERYDAAPAPAAPDVTSMVKEMRKMAEDCAFEEMSDLLNRAAAALLAKLGQGWTPVSERLPERADWYGAIDADGERRAAYFRLPTKSWLHTAVGPIKYWCEFPPVPGASDD